MEDKLTDRLHEDLGVRPGGAFGDRPAEALPQRGGRSSSTGSWLCLV